MGLKEVKLALNAEDSIQERFIRFLERLKRNQRNKLIDKQFLFDQREALRIENGYSPTDAELQLLFSKSLILDLLLQGWYLKNKKGELCLAHTAKGEEGLDSLEIKEKVRNNHLLARDLQLQEPSVTDFIERMERRSFTSKGWISIFSLMRDGEELQEATSQLRSLSEQEDLSEAEILSASKKVIDPYVQFAEPGKKCDYTDFYLTDIWRYFRHTWITEYKTLPGRSISILIRDAAAKNHPVIGIAALGSSMAQLTVRDKWIGWESETFVDSVIKSPTKTELDWVLKTTDALIAEIFIEDLKTEGILQENELNEPSKELIACLRKRAESEKELHRKFPHESKKTSENETIDWKQRAQTPLFKSKRYNTLAELLQVRLLFKKYGIEKGLENFEKALKFSEFRSALGRIVRRRKGQRVGIDMMDVIICGSIAPYNHLLGGKLVCLLLTSPEIVEYYNQKYSRRESLIASAMAGKPIVRKPNLSFLATTSLYGVGSSQYNRIKMPISFFDDSDKESKIEYINFGISEGFGSFHFSKETLSWAHQYLGRRTGGRRVNSIFGEGANPLMRKLREAIELLGFESEPILRHEQRRIIYGIPLVKNAKNVLLGFDEKPDYLIPTSYTPREATNRIVEFWMLRWFLKRIQNDAVLAQVKEHIKAYPVTHGARVPLYKLKTRAEDIFPSY